MAHKKGLQKGLCDQRHPGWHICGYQLKIVQDKHGLKFHFVSAIDTSETYQAQILLRTELFGQINSIFRGVDSFFDYLDTFSQDKERVMFQSDGMFTVTYYRSQARPKTARNFCLRTSRVVRKDTIKDKQKEIDIIVGQNQQLKDTIHRLKKENSENYRRLKELKDNLRSFKRKSIKSHKRLRKRLCKEKEKLEERVKGGNRQSAQRLKNKQQQQERSREKISEAEQREKSIWKMEERISQLQRSIKKTRQTLKNAEQVEMNDLKQRIKTKRDKEDSLLGTKLNVTIDQNNRYLQEHFRMNGNTVEKIMCYKSLQVLGNEVFPQGKSYYYLYVDKINWEIFSVGICHQNRRNQINSFEHEDCIAYFGKTGAIWENGNQRAGGPSIPNNSEVQVVVNRDKKMVKWFMNGKQIGSTLMNDRLATGRIVPYVQLNYPDNRVTFNCKPKQQLEEL